MKFRKTTNGKGDGYRPVDIKKYNDNWDNIFGKAKEKHEKEESNKAVPEKD